MIKNGFEGAESCMEIISPHFGGNTFVHNSIAGLEQVSMTDASVDEMGAALGYFYRVFDCAGPQIMLDESPEAARNMVLALRDSVKARIAARGVDPENYNTAPSYS